MRRIARSYLDDLCGKIALSDLVMRTLPMRRAGSEWAACCPFHPERSASFFVNDQKRFFHCFGCSAHGSAIAWLMRTSNLPFSDAVAELEKIAGQPPMSDAAKFEANISARADEQANRDMRRAVLSDEQRGRQARARVIWRHAGAIPETLAEAYLGFRCIAARKWPPTLRFVERAWHGWEQTNHPALIGAIQDGNGQVTAVQTIFLRQDGLGKAGVTPGKPVTGPMMDGAVRLAKPGPVLGIAEGIETALSARQIYSLPVWATLGAARLGAVRVPDIVKQIVIFADSGERGKEEAFKAIPKYEDQGCGVIIEFPPDGASDFNDVLQRQMRAA